MRGITQKIVSEKRIDLTVPKIGYVQLTKFAHDFDHGLYATRPWHVVTFGRNFATVEECVSFLETIVANWDNDTRERKEDSRTSRMLDCGYQAYAREEGHFS